jgi:hypothetical protein
MKTVIRTDALIEHMVDQAWRKAGGSRVSDRRGDILRKSANSAPSILRDDDAVALLVKNARERAAHDARMAWGGPVEINAIGRPMAKAGRADPIAGFVRALNEARRTPIKPTFAFGNGR